jgi:hypothetical protein
MAKGKGKVGKKFLSITLLRRPVKDITEAFQIGKSNIWFQLLLPRLRKVTHLT